MGERDNNDDDDDDEAVGSGVIQRSFGAWAERN
jgi:hypothetical protein